MLRDEHARAAPKRPPAAAGEAPKLTWMLALLCWTAAATPAAGEQTKTAVERGRAIYVEHCSSCHGAELQGEEDWQSRNPDGTLRAPPHDDSGHTWHHGDRLLAEYVRLGGAAALAARGVDDFQSGMPAFGGTLDAGDIDAVLEFIRSHWSERARAYQRAVTEAEE